MKRRLFNLAAAVSLVMLVVSLISWSVSRWRFEQVGYNHPPGDWSLAFTIFSGEFAIYLAPASPYALAGWGHWSYPADTPTVKQFLVGTTAGFDVSRCLSGTRVMLPLWSVAAASLVLPGLWLLRRRRERKRALRYCCSKCGYDLRASGGACPECGAERTSRGAG
jgi:hypothetical protein